MSVNDYRFRSIHDMEADKFDRFTRSVTTLDWHERAVHEGFLYTASYEKTGLSNNGTIDILLQTPSEGHPHLESIDYSTDGGPITLEIFEGSTVSSIGTEITSINRNRCSTIDSEIIISHTPTIIDTDTSLVKARSPVAVRDSFNTGGELALHCDQNYLIRVTNKSGGSRQVDLQISWCEVAWRKAVSCG